jgi:histidinol phosphatase-like enzyme
VLGAELARSWVIGNALRDVEAGLAAGCAGAVLIGPEPAPALGPRVLHAADLPAAVEQLLLR